MTVTVTNAVDYTYTASGSQPVAEADNNATTSRYVNSIPILNNSISINKSNTPPPIPESQALTVLPIYNANAADYGLVYDSTLQALTVVGYKLTANYQNDQALTRDITYYVYENRRFTTWKGTGTQANPARPGVDSGLSASSGYIGQATVSGITGSDLSASYAVVVLAGTQLSTSLAGNVPSNYIVLEDKFTADHASVYSQYGSDLSWGRGWQYFFAYDAMISLNNTATTNHQFPYDNVEYNGLDILGEAVNARYQTPLMLSYPYRSYTDEAGAVTYAPSTTWAYYLTDVDDSLLTEDNFKITVGTTASYMTLIPSADVASPSLQTCRIAAAAGKAVSTQLKFRWLIYPETEVGEQDCFFYTQLAQETMSASAVTMTLEDRLADSNALYLKLTGTEGALRNIAAVKVVASDTGGNSTTFYLRLDITPAAGAESAYGTASIMASKLKDLSGSATFYFYALYDTQLTGFQYSATNLYAVQVMDAANMYLVPNASSNGLVASSEGINSSLFTINSFSKTDRVARVTYNALLGGFTGTLSMDMTAAGVYYSEDSSQRLTLKQLGQVKIGDTTGTSIVISTPIPFIVLNRANDLTVSVDRADVAFKVEGARAGTLLNDKVHIALYQKGEGAYADYTLVDNDAAEVTVDYADATRYSVTITGLSIGTDYQIRYWAELDKGDGTYREVTLLKQEGEVVSSAIYEFTTVDSVVISNLAHSVKLNSYDDKHSITFTIMPSDAQKVVVGGTYVMRLFDAAGNLIPLGMNGAVDNSGAHSIQSAYTFTVPAFDLTDVRSGERVTYTELNAAATYQIKVIARYDLEDGAGVTESVVGQTTFYTAGVRTLGYALYDTAFSNITASSADIKVTMSYRTLRALRQMLLRVDISVETGGNSVLRYVLTKNAAVCTDADGTESDVTADLGWDADAWDTFIGGTGDGVPFAFTADGLTHKTQYSLVIHSYLRQGDQEYDMKAAAVDPTFRTLEKTPELLISDLFAAENFFELYDLCIDDPDEAITGSVTMRVYKASNDTLIYHQQLTPNTVYDDIRIDSGVENDTEYRVSFYASQYNTGYTTATYQAAYEMPWMELNVTTSNSLYGSINLTSLGGTSAALSQGQHVNLFDLSAAQDNTAINGSGVISTNANYVISDYIPVEPGAKYRLVGLGWPYYSYYDANYQRLSTVSSGNNSIVLATVPDGAAYLRVCSSKATVAAQVGTQDGFRYCDYAGVYLYASPTMSSDSAARLAVSVIDANNSLAGMNVTYSVRLYRAAGTAYDTTGVEPAWTDDGTVTHVDFKNISLSSARMTQFGCIGRIGGTLEHIRLTDITVVNASNYTGGLAGFVMSGTAVSDITATGTTLPDVENETAQWRGSYYVEGGVYTGGVFGYVIGSPLDGITARGLQVLGKANYFGGIAGYAAAANESIASTYSRFTDTDASALRVECFTASDYVGGVAGFCGTSNGVTVRDFLVLNLAGQYTGGAYGRLYDGTAVQDQCCGIRVSNGTVIGSKYVGGLSGRCDHCNISINTCTVTDVTVEARDNTPEDAADDSGWYAGGLFGYNSGYGTTVSNGVYGCTVTAYQYAGGVSGYQLYAGVAYYTVQDTAVQATRFAGGLAGQVEPWAGRVQRYNLIEADVTATESYAGGLFGQMNAYNNVQNNIDYLGAYGNIFTGTVTAGDYAGGIVGLAVDPINVNTTTQYAQLVAGSVTSDGHASFFGFYADGRDIEGDLAYMRLHQDATLNGVKASQKGYGSYSDATTDAAWKATLVVTNADLSNSTFYTLAASRGGLGQWGAAYADFTSLLPMYKDAGCVNGAELTPLTARATAGAETQIALFTDLPDGAYNAAVSAGSSVSDGLTVRYDAYASARTDNGWTDLSGSGNDAVALVGSWSEDIWGTDFNCWSPNGQRQFMQLPESVRTVADSRDFTVEMTVSLDTSQNGHMLFGGWSRGATASDAACQPFAVLYLCSNSRLYVYWGSISFNTLVPELMSGVHTLTITVTPLQQKLYVDGALKTTWDRTSELSEIHSNQLVLGGATGYTGYYMSGTYYAFRMYDRVLTAAEAAYNARLDENRFVYAMGAQDGVIGNTAAAITVADGAATVPVTVSAAGRYLLAIRLTDPDTGDTAELQMTTLEVAATQPAAVVFLDAVNDEGDALDAAALYRTRITEPVTLTAQLSGGSADNVTWYRAESNPNDAIVLGTLGARADVAAVGTESTIRLCGRGYYWCEMTAGGTAVRSRVLYVDTWGFFPRMQFGGSMLFGTEDFQYASGAYLRDGNGLRIPNDTTDANIDGGVRIPNDGATSFALRSFRALFAMRFLQLLPDAAVYPSGAGTLNIEFDDDALPLTEDGAENTGASFRITDKNGTVLVDEPIRMRVYTLAYDYRQDLTLTVYNGTREAAYPIEADALCRTVSVSGTRYYYLNKNGVGGTNELVGSFLHLWNGTGLLENGNLVDLVGNGVTGKVGKIRLVDTQPIFTADYAGKQVDTYWYFSAVDGEAVPYRLYAKDGTLFAADPLFADEPFSVVADTYLGGRYLTVLRDGSLYDLEKAIALPDDFRNAAIAEVAPTVFGTAHIAVIRYASGAVAAFDYLSGARLDADSDLGDQTLITFAQSYFTSRVDAARTELADGYLALIELREALIVNGLTEDMLITGSQADGTGAGADGASMADGSALGTDTDGAQADGTSLADGTDTGRGSAASDGAGEGGQQTGLAPDASLQQESSAQGGGTSAGSGTSAGGGTAAGGGASSGGGTKLRTIAVYNAATGTYDLYLESDLLSGSGLTVERRMELAGIDPAAMGVNRATPVSSGHTRMGAWAVVLTVALILSVLAGGVLLLRHNQRRAAHERPVKGEKRK